MTKAVASAHYPSCEIKHLARAWGQFGVSLPPPPIRPLGRHELGRYGVVHSPLFWRDTWLVRASAARTYTGCRRSPSKSFQARPSEPLHPLHRLSLGWGLVDAYRTDPPADEPLTAFLVHRHEDAALVGALAVETVGGAGPVEHGLRVSARRLTGF